MGAAAVGFCWAKELRTNSSAENAERNMGLVSNMGELQLDFGALVRGERNVARLGEIFLQDAGVGVFNLGIIDNQEFVVTGRELRELEGGDGSIQVKGRNRAHQSHGADLRLSTFGDNQEDGGIVACVKGDPAFENRKIVAQDDFDRLNGRARRDG